MATGDTTIYDGQQSVENVTVKSNGQWKKVTLGGVAGIVLGTAAGYAANSMMAKDADTKEAKTGTEDNKSVDGKHGTTANHATGYDTENIAQATCVNDDMSFGDAFEAARNEVGAGGSFVWHGNVYTTFHAEEWEAMSHDEQVAFSRGAIAGAEMPQTHKPDVAMNSTETEQHTEEHGAETTETDSNVRQASQETGDQPEVEILGVTESNIGGHDVFIGGMTINGENVMLIDSDENGHFDHVIHDTNHNNRIEEDEIKPIEENNTLTVENFANASGMPNPMESRDFVANNDMPDYVNDTDPTLI